MPTINPGPASFATALADETALQRLVGDMANMIEPGDMITLSGGLGAGKTTFARALIRMLAADSTVEVPSPTFTLVQAYELPRFPLVHADLYRISDPAELGELGLDDLASGAVVLLEWPERAGGLLPANRIDIALALAPERGLTYRDLRVTGYGATAGRVERLGAGRRFLEEASFAGAERERVQGDASTRLYERLRLDDKVAILMNAPRRPDGPPVRDGRPYSAIARLAEDVTPFVAMANGLRARGLSAPEVFHADLAQGLLLLEDLGEERVVSGTPPAPIVARYEAAVDVLVALHADRLPDTLPVSPALDYRLPRYDVEAFLIEAELVLDWYLPRFGANATAADRSEFQSLWREALRPALAETPTWVLRDYHSPNLLWLPDRMGIARVGLLDFQDAVMGPAAYDVASLLQDARVDVPEPLERALLKRYVVNRTALDDSFDGAAFTALYALMAAQRATKILGIFARLDRRDGKPQYLRHMPRIWAYLQRALAHPALAPLRVWYDGHVPALRTL